MLINIDEDLSIERLESLRVPFKNPECDPSWKDWYHYILINPLNGIKILFNICLSGRLNKGEIQISVVVKVPGEDATFADVRSFPWEDTMVNKTPLVISTTNTLFQFKKGVTDIGFSGKYPKVYLKITLKPRSLAVHIDEKAKFGSGYIGWSFIPSMIANGHISIDDNFHEINENWYCYHDRNFGVFRWGEDIGWEWIVCNLIGENGLSYQVVFDQRTNKNHSDKGFPYAFLFEENVLKKIFVGTTLRVYWERDLYAKTPLRLPGHLATVFSQSVSLDILSVTLNATDDRDSLQLNLTTEKNYQLIVPDYQYRQYTIMEEVSGKANLEFTINGDKVNAKGYFYGEFVR